MKKVEVYQTSDGSVFDDLASAQAHEAAGQWDVIVMKFSKVFGAESGADSPRAAKAQQTRASAVAKGFVEFLAKYGYYDGNSFSNVPFEPELAGKVDLVIAEIDKALAEAEAKLAEGKPASVAVATDEPSEAELPAGSYEVNTVKVAPPPPA
jgi:hypothetical protein